MAGGPVHRIASNLASVITSGVSRFPWNARTRASARLSHPTAKVVRVTTNDRQGDNDMSQIWEEEAARERADEVELIARNILAIYDPSVAVNLAVAEWRKAALEGSLWRPVLSFSQWVTGRGV